MDRLLFWLVIIFVPSAVVTGRWLTGHFYWTDAIITPVATIGCLAFMYLLRDQPKDEPADYTRVIANIEHIGGRLAELAVFLKQERQKVMESEAIVRRLQDEQTHLEPIVGSQRATVDALFAELAKRLASRSRNERLFGFISGVIASLVAAMLLEYFRR